MRKRPIKQEDVMERVNDEMLNRAKYLAELEALLNVFCQEHGATGIILADGRRLELGGVDKVNERYQGR